MRRVGFFGPFGTFAEQALRTQADLAAAEAVAYPTVPDVFDAVAAGEVDRGVVPIENSIEGVVNFTQDALVFDYDLLITREIVLDIELCLVARPGLALDDVKVVLSIPVATAQCHRFLRQQLPGVEVRAANSTAEAARLVAEDEDHGGAAISPRVAADRYGLDGARRATSPTTRATRRASSSSPATASRPAPATTGRRWSSTSGPTSRAA